MSDPLLPVPPESEEERAEDDVAAVERDEQPDVLPGPGDDRTGTAARDAGAYRPPHAGDRLSEEELADDLDEPEPPR